MTDFNAESMHRLAKMALDSGEVASPEEAVALFSRYRLRVHLGAGWAGTLAGQACFLTALNTAVRAFLGGVEVNGDLDHTLDVPLFQGRSARLVAEELGAQVAGNTATALPTLVVGAAPEGALPEFCVRLSWDLSLIHIWGIPRKTRGSVRMTKGKQRCTHQKQMRP